MKKEQLEIIKDELSEYIKQCCLENEVCFSIWIQEGKEKTSNIDEIICSKTNENESWCIEAILPSGKTLRCSGEKIDVSKLKDAIDVLKVCTNEYRDNCADLNCKLVCENKEVNANFELLKQEEFTTDVQLLDLISKYHFSMKQIFNKKYQLKIRTYCLQFQELNVMINSRGCVICKNILNNSIRTEISIGNLKLQFSICGENLSEIKPEDLFDKILKKYKYKIDLLNEGIYNENLECFGEASYLAFDFDSFGEILHEGVGHALEYTGKKYGSPYIIGEQLACKNVTILDLGMESEWAFVPYDEYGNRRENIILIQNGEVKSLLTGILGARQGLQWNYCDRRDRPNDLMQSRMSCISLKIDESERNQMQVPSKYNNFSTLIIVGSQSGFYNIKTQEVTICPELFCRIVGDKIFFKKGETLSFFAKKPVSNILDGFGPEQERYNFCTKNHQTISTSSRSNQFVLTKNFLKKFG